MKREHQGLYRRVRRVRTLDQLDDELGHWMDHHEEWDLVDQLAVGGALMELGRSLCVGIGDRLGATSARLRELNAGLRQLYVELIEPEEAYRLETWDEWPSWDDAMPEHSMEQ